MITMFQHSYFWCMQRVLTWALNHLLHIMCYSNLFSQHLIWLILLIVYTTIRKHKMKCLKVLWIEIYLFLVSKRVCCIENWDRCFLIEYLRFKSENMRTFWLHICTFWNHCSKAFHQISKMRSLFGILNSMIFFTFALRWTFFFALK